MDLKKWLDYVNIDASFDAHWILIMFFFEWPLYESMHPAFMAVFVFVGALLGSFFNVLSQRWGGVQIAANDEQSALWMKIRGTTTGMAPSSCKSLMGGRSACPQCKAPIPLCRNIPIISWLIQLGKSNCCKKPISVRYLAFELVGAAVFLSLAWIVSPSIYALTIGVLVMILFLISVIDMQDGFIPDSLLLLALGIGLALSTHQYHWITPSISIQYLVITALCVVSFFGLLSKLVGRGVIGGADQYLLAISAAIQGPVFFFTLPILVLGLIITSIVIKSGVMQRGIFTRLIDAEKSVPAGPAICLSMVAGIFMSLVGLTL